ncbi:MAG: hypothetical protein LBM64_09955 [Deltaproteobacteria bacterium]|jgi:hypothetical protein|nr:hypothetical protein [Deltaproteobacteria bacterium]
MSDNTSPRGGGKAKAKKKRGLKFLFLLLLLLAGGGIWASLEYMRSGEVLIPMPEEASKFINDNLVPGGRLGPVRFGGYAAGTAQPAPVVVQNVKPDSTALPPVSVIPLEPAPLPDLPPDIPPEMQFPSPEETEADSGAADVEDSGEVELADSGSSAVSQPSVEAEPAQPDPAAAPQAAPQPEASPVPPRAATPRAAPPARPPQPVAGGKVTPPDTGWRDEVATPYEEIRETAPAPGDSAYPEEPAPRRRPSWRDVAVFETPEPEARAMGPDAGSSLVVAFDSSAEKRATALMPVNLSSEQRPSAGAGQRSKVYSGVDSVVSLDFVGDLATYLAASYWPAGTHPAAQGKDISTASLTTLNQRYGLGLRGFSAGSDAARDYSRERELILDYVFMPSMIQALTNLYLDRFVDALAAMETVPDARGGARRLGKAQRAGMLEYYSAEARALSEAINAYASAPNAAALTNAYIRLEQEAQRANYIYLEAKQALEIAAEAGDPAAVREAGRDVARLEAAYRRSMERQRNAEAAVRAVMTKGTSGRLGGGDLVYLASWLNRRVAADDTLRAAVAVTRFAAEVMAERAGVLRAE